MRQATFRRNGRAVASVANSATLTAAPKRERARVLALTGPTGVGKTALSLLLANRLNGEIVSADSAQMYRQFDIGTNKVSQAVRSALRWSAAESCLLAQARFVIT